MQQLSATLSLICFTALLPLQLCFADTQVGTPLRLTNSPYEDRGPQWDPASNTIAYQSSAVEVGSPYQISQVNADLPGESIMATGLTETEGLAHSLSWVGSTGFLGVAERLQYREYLFFNTSMAPFDRTVYDGSDAAFTVKLLVTRYAGGELLRLSRDGSTALWRWSNDFTRGTQQIRTAPVASLNGQVAHGVGQICINESSQVSAWFLHGAALTPDGSRFVIPLPRSTVGEALDTPGSPHDLWLYNSNCSGTPINLTNSRSNGIHARFPDVSPDGRKIIFSRWAGSPADTWDLYQINIDGTALEQLTATPWFTEYEPSWGPDGTRVTFRGQHLSGSEDLPPALPPGEGSNANIYVMDVLPDCDNNDLPDLCEIPCQDQSCADRCELLGCGAPGAQCFTRTDCDANQIPDNCDLDSDGDGTPDSCDGCANDPLKIEPGFCGCGVPDSDSDQDGTPDCADECPSDPEKIVAGSCGCGVPETDSDGDGTPDCVDLCPADPLKVLPGSCGCGALETDGDGDGTPDCIDECPNDPAKIQPGSCGCGVPETDSDGDGTPNCVDLCPDDAFKTAPGSCGCGVPDTDSDGDGTPNCNDFCPNDAAKTEPGLCGCGVSDFDTDGDGTPDCTDACPADPGKIAAGVCGCGVSDADSDGDGAADCDDRCRLDPDKLQPGICGCGQPDTDSDGDGTADCFDACPQDENKIAVGMCGCGTLDSDSDGDLTPDCIESCLSGPGPFNEVCDGQDNDCDGLSDEGLNCDEEPEDCSGVRGGQARRDHCGVCEGDGTSCSECRFTDISEKLLALEQLMGRHIKIANRLTRPLKRGSKQDKRFAAKTIAQLTAVHQNSADITSRGVPRIIADCADSAFCSTVSHAAALDQYSKNLKLLNATVARLIKKLGQRLAVKKSKGLKKQSTAISQQGARLLASLPGEHSECR